MEQVQAAAVPEEDEEDDEVERMVSLGMPGMSGMPGHALFTMARGSKSSQGMRLPHCWLHAGRRPRRRTALPLCGSDLPVLQPALWAPPPTPNSRVSSPPALHPQSPHFILLPHPPAPRPATGRPTPRSASCRRPAPASTLCCAAAWASQSTGW